MLEIVSVQGLPFLACLVMLAILCYIGIHVLEREIIFIDIALAQIAAVGAIAAHLVFHFHGHSIHAHAMAFASTFVAAAFFAVVRRRIVQIPLEAVIGVSYAVSAAAALFLVGVSPGGHVHVQEMLAGSILWATWSDVLWSAGVFAVVGLCFYLFRGPIRAISEGYDEAVSKGYNTLGWDFLFYALVGVVITMAVRVAGVVVVFTFLIIPATLSAVFASGWTGRLVVAWVAGALATALGLLFAERYDFSVGPAIASFLGVGLIVVGLLRALRVAKRPAAMASLVLFVVVGVWLAAGTRAGDVVPGGLGAGAGFAGAPDASSFTHSHSSPGGPGSEPAARAETQGEEITPEVLDSTSDIEQLRSFYAKAGDADTRSRVVCRALEVDVRAGAAMAIEFLSGDPPLLYRLTVVDKLEEVTGRELRYDIDQPFSAPPNQEAVAVLEKAVGLE